MFDMENFELELDAQNAALESLISELEDDDNLAMESSIALTSKLEKVQQRVDRCTTAQECYQLKDQISNEISKYNSALESMKEAAESFKLHNDKVVLKADLERSSDAIKNSYTAITLLPASEGYLATDDEIKTVQAFLTKSNDIISAACESFDTLDDPYTDFIAGSDLEIAEEGVKDALDGIRRGLASVCKSLAAKCKTHAKTASSKGNKRMYKIWNGLYTWFSDACQSLVNAMSKESLDKWRERVDGKKTEVKKHEQEMKTKTMNANSDNQGKKIYDWDDPTGDSDGNESYVVYDKIIDAAYEAYDLAVMEYHEAMESSCNATEENFIQFAMEGIISPDQKQKWSIKYGQTRKEIKGVIKAAKAAAKSGDYAKAIGLYKKAKNGYKGLLSIANKIPDKQIMSGSKFADGSDTYKGSAKTSAIAWVNKQISACDAAILKLQNKQKKSAANEACGTKKACESSVEEALLDLDLVCESLTDCEDSDPLAGLDDILAL